MFQKETVSNESEDDVSAIDDSIGAASASNVAIVKPSNNNNKIKPTKQVKQFLSPGIFCCIKGKGSY